MEGAYCVKYLFIVVLLVIQLQGFSGCVQEERLGLLKLKAFFKFCGNESFNALPSWVDHGVADCCMWERVKCNATTRRVLEISLGELLRYSGGPNCYLNASLFQPFEELKSLNLSYNRFSDLAEAEGFEGFSGLKGLEMLDLGYNNFSNSIISSLSGLTSIKTLILRSNELEGSVPTHDVATLRNLKILDLSKNGLFIGSISLEDLRNLRVLDLSNNKFNGTLPILGLCELNSLIELDISMNDISDELPQCLSNLTDLRFLDISSNLFRGKMQHIIASLTSLEYLSLANNCFEGLFSFSSLANHSRLKVFQLSARDGHKLQVETEDSKWLPTFQLKVLSLHNAQLNRQTTSQIPSFLLSQYDLRYIDLAYNELVGRFPFWLLQNNSKLEYINLTNNTFSGNLQLPTFKHDLLRLQLSSNKFSGQLPVNMGLILPNVIFINISRNSFVGILPSSIGEMQKVCVLDLSHNEFSGKVPISMFSNMSLLECLILGNNHFTGRIEDGYSNNTVLTVLDISNNLISGRIPSWIGCFTNIKVLQMSENLLKDELPTELCSLQTLIFLDLSYNQLFGRIPSCFNLSSLNYLYIQGNNLSGLIPRALSRSSHLITLDLSRNKLSGGIPYWLDDFRRLHVLLLKENQLEGPIPQQICQLRQLSILDLSGNKLSGSIPSCLGNMSFGNVGNGDGHLLRQIRLYGWFKFLFSPGMFYNATLEYSLFTGTGMMSEGQVEIDFTTKNRFNIYRGDILNYMFGLDLSSNKLTGHIPLQIGDLQRIRALNMSRNGLIGLIPETISHLRLLESLDLSYNFLSGKIPPQLSELNYLAIFNVSFNNLSGTTPTANQFATFLLDSYLGNPYLCGRFLENNCPSFALPPSSQPDAQLDEDDKDETTVDMIAFYWSFAASYVTILLGLVIILCINPCWRRKWFRFVDVCCSYLHKYI